MTICVIGMLMVLMGFSLGFVANQDNRKEDERKALKVFAIGAVMMVGGMAVAIFTLLFYGI